jgi:hypothetical protein
LPDPFGDHPPDEWPPARVSRKGLRDVDPYFERSDHRVAAFFPLAHLSPLEDP